MTTVLVPEVHPGTVRTQREGHVDLPCIALDRLVGLVDAATLETEDVRSSVVTGSARIRGVRCKVFATDPTVHAGALSADDCRAVARVVEGATRARVPVVGMWHSAGARVQEGIASLDGMGRIFAAATAASGRIPHLALVMGTAAGGAAYGSALADLVITAPDSRLFVTGPAVVKEVTGEDVDAATLGGPDVHDRRSGLTHVRAGSETEAFQAVGRLVRLLGRPLGRPPRALPPDPRLERVLPARRRRAYDVRPLVHLLLDPGGRPVELQPNWAPNLVTTIGRLDGRSVGVLANNPLRLGGCLDGRAADKGARFVRMCDALGIPLVVVVDVPGFLPGAQQEWDGVVRRGAKLLHAFAEARVARVTLITHKAYGGAYIAMNSKSLGASAVLAWPSAEVAVMGAEAAARVVHRRSLDALPQQRRADCLVPLVAEQQAALDVRHALDLGLVDRVVDPASTRSALAEALSLAKPARGDHGNIPL